MDINFRFVLCVIVNSSSTVSATVAVDVAVAVVAVVVVAVVAVDENDLDVAVVGNAIAHVIHLESALPWTAVQWGHVATLVAVVLVVVD